MKIVILEDERVAARRLKRLILNSLGENSTTIELFNNLDDGLDYVEQNSVDLLFLDLNLNGEDGFDVLRKISDAPFQTIVVSANTDHALDAFELGVIDFIPKPFDEQRLQTALSRFTGKLNRLQGTTTLAIKNRGDVKFVPVADLVFVKGAGDYAELHCKNGDIHLHNKSMEQLSEILVDQFIRIHKSFLICRSEIDQIKIYGGGKYGAILKSGDELPVSRSRYKELTRDSEI